MNLNPNGRRIWHESVDRRADIFIGRDDGRVHERPGPYTPLRISTVIRRPGRPQGFRATINDAAFFAGEPQ